MVDIVDSATRSRMMSGIRGKNTKPEIALRKMLHAAGFRFRLHNRKLPGKPDLVFAQYRTVVFVHGCFWHGHENCDRFRLPKTRPQFWSDKIRQNIERDYQQVKCLLEAGWKVAIVWECALIGKRKIDSARLTGMLDCFIRNPSLETCTFTGVRDQTL